MINKMELLAPAGGERQLKAAVESGADAVYMGGYAFNARSSAKNFSPEEMRSMIGYCHLYGVKVHIAVNTLIKERELDEMMDYVYSLNRMGADALIIQDMGAARLIRTALPDMELHASTQMTVTSLEGVKYLENMGFSRVVLARELSKDEIAYICAGSGIDIEVFVHGAICQCYSGQCLMSSMIGGRSGNRGRCAQPCRLNYSISRNGRIEKTGYLLSPKDMSMINRLKELEEIGVKSLKIEGRLKRPEYVSAVTGIYRNYLDYPRKAEDKDVEELKNAFSRTGLTDGYFTANLGAGMMSGKTPSNTAGTFSDLAKARAAEGALFRKIPIYIAASVTAQNGVEVTAYDDDGNYAAAKGNKKAEYAANRPIDAYRIKQQLLKLGQTPFAADDAEVFVEEGISVPVSEINYARREAVRILADKRSEPKPGREININHVCAVNKTNKKPVLTANVANKEQAETAINKGIKIIYAPEEIAGQIKREGIRVITHTSDIFDPKKTENEDVLVSSNAGAYFYAKKRLFGGFRLNIYNSAAADCYAGFEAVTLSPELTIKEMSDLVQNTSVPVQVIVYGRIPLMIMKNCPLKAAGKCQNGKLIYTLKDRKNEEFPVICQKNCVCEIINSKPLYMADKFDDLIKLPLDFLNLRFTVETAKECEEIIMLYSDALEGKSVYNPFGPNDFTRGHFYSKVE